MKPDVTHRARLASRTGRGRPYLSNGVGTSRCDVPARVRAGGTNRAARACHAHIAPLDGARTAQRAVPTTALTTYGVIAAGLAKISFAAILSLDHTVALAQPAPAAGLPDTESAPAAAVALAPAQDTPANALYPGTVMGGSWATQTGRYYPHNHPSIPAGPATVIHFSQPEPRTMDALQEDLNVLSFLLQKKLEDAIGENSPTYRMGIPLLLRSGQRSIESLYLDGFGALFTLNVNFPLLAPPVTRPKETDTAPRSDDWDKARKEIYGVREPREAGNPYAAAVAPYDAEQVGALKRTLLEALKNAANVRGLKPEESAVVTVFGTEAVEAAAGTPGGAGGGGGPHSGAGLFEIPRVATSGGYGGGGVFDPNTATSASAGMPAFAVGRGTVLTVRVRKSDAESYAKGKLSFEQFQEKANISAYIGAARTGGAWRSGAYSGGYSVAPVAR